MQTNCLKMFQVIYVIFPEILWSCPIYLVIVVCQLECLLFPFFDDRNIFLRTTMQFKEKISEHFSSVNEIEWSKIPFFKRYLIASTYKRKIPDCFVQGVCDIWCFFDFFSYGRLYVYMMPVWTVILCLNTTVSFYYTSLVYSIEFQFISYSLIPSFSP